VLTPVSAGHDVACQRWPVVKQAVRGEAERSVRPFADVSDREPLLDCRSLTITYGGSIGLSGRISRRKPFVAVQDLDLTIGPGETLALVGESGSGKSTVARAISGLLEPVAGEIRFEGETLSPSFKDRTSEQRRKIQFIFQNPDASLNPRRRVGDILARPLELFRDMSRRQSEPTVVAALADVQLEAAYASRYPDQLSGGERQRVAIARALIAGPELLLCDEILSALDVSVQANMIELLRRLAREHSVAMLFISHDLAVVRTLADRVGVLFRGQIMETGSNAEIFEPPYHPYTYALLKAVPTVTTVRTRKAQSLVPEPIRGAACAFAGRCQWQVGQVCVDVPPPWRKTGRDLGIRCHIPLPELARLGADLRPTPLPHPQTRTLAAS
jgi:peptide/nickel transport system ATP-binding protein